MSREEDAYVIERMGKLLAEIAIIVNGAEPHDTLWSYHDLPEKVRALKQAQQPPLPPEISSLPRYAREEIARRERILLDRIAELEAENASLRQHLRVAAGDILRLASTREALTNQLDALRADQDDDNA